jgi:hypothetical protein
VGGTNGCEAGLAGENCDEHHFAQVSAGGFNTCGLRLDGSIFCWGDNAKGQNNVPPGMDDFIALSAGFRHVCAIRQDTSLACWGQDYMGSIANTPDDTGYAEVSTGSYFACARSADHLVTCWGSNADGKADAPVNLYAQVSAGGTHGCGLLQTQFATCWGDSDQPSNSLFLNISAGVGEFSCGINFLGKTECWGDVTFTSAEFPAQGVLKDIQAGFMHACVHQEDGEVTCAGSGTAANTPVPEGVFQELSVGASHNCGLRESGVAECWGSSQGSKGNVPKPEFGEALCSDGFDNDSDGVADCQDDACHGTNACIQEGCSNQYDCVIDCIGSGSFMDSCTGACIDPLVPDAVESKLLLDGLTQCLVTKCGNLLNTACVKPALFLFGACHAEALSCSVVEAWGGCGALEDQEIMLQDAWALDAFTDCLVAGCVNGTTDSCMDCIVDKSGLSPGCAVCLAGLGECAAAECGDFCEDDSNLLLCEQCVLLNSDCGEEYEQCAGALWQPLLSNACHDSDDCVNGCSYSQGCGCQALPGSPEGACKGLCSTNSQCNDGEACVDESGEGISYCVSS